MTLSLSESLDRQMHEKYSIITKAIQDYEQAVKHNEQELIKEFQGRFQTGQKSIFPNSDFVYDSLRILNRVFTYQTYQLPDPETQWKFKQDKILFTPLDMGAGMWFVTVRIDGWVANEQ
ncbi:hypothetical protein D5R38_18680 [Serratia marcescens]|uniref:hypothetical protein n=1 Tax=Serratia marcescens TaxID=615 RepID=UPI0010673797|nr:hypothetical protein [Serratia marcescens]TEW83397.1 hypothetical protein D5R38_18680 [Serratia marcescens]